MTRLFVKRRKPVLEALGQFLLLLSFVAAIMYGGSWYPANISPFIPVLVKACAVGFLALFVLISMQSFNHFLLFLALVASVTGDVFLSLFHEQAFMHGLLSFLVAHVFFIILYLKNRLRVADISMIRIRIAAVLWALAAIAAYFLYPHLGDMMLPVYVYSAVLTLMATTAIFSKYPIRLVALGAILFLVSDSLLGARQFMSLPDYLGYFVWGTYYFAQLFMTVGVMLTDERRTHFGGYRFD
ncbi:lysoplasmalogenase [Kordiimonas pumila]|uniref:Lysoplasmalogenase n=1 Tax=Kordiimonas pumila TaxID=2161677 RepID=A0ABV7D1E1_9PROT|nr:lysoplasmalogenase [Kordiimonas pumila]